RDSLQSKKSAALWVPGISAGDRLVGTLRTRLQRRGRDARAEFEGVSRFPLGLFEVRATGPILENGKRVSSSTGGRLVFPRPRLPDELRRDLEAARYEAEFPQGFEPDPGGEFRGVRAYRSGDPVKSVHWPATARMGELMVREWDPPAPRPLRFGLLFHTLSPGNEIRMHRPERWEMALRLIAGITVYCRDTEIPLTFANATGTSEAGGVEWIRVPESAGCGALLEWAALAERGASANRATVAAALSRLGEECDRVFVVSDVPLRIWKGVVESQSLDVPVVGLDAETMKPMPRRLLNLADLKKGKPSQPVSS
ncbi:MAG: DUF58 domain-containing protein, partial [Verrucomicrobiae bacterium]|nr:DUF58 domain-containing protein [Verrucomicrobiae bacterium]